MAPRREATGEVPTAPAPTKAKTPKPPKNPARLGKTKSRAKNAPRERCPKPTGRPVVEIDREQLETLAKIGCTYEEMAAVLKVDRDTLSSRFSADIQRWREGGRSSLRRKQWSSALGGNVTMLIWLGKQELGQRDFKSVETTGKDGGPIQVQDLSADERQRRILNLLNRAEGR